MFSFTLSWYTSTHYPVAGSLTRVCIPRALVGRAFTATKRTKSWGRNCWALSVVWRAAAASRGGGVTQPAALVIPAAGVGRPGLTGIVARVRRKCSNWTGNSPVIQIRRKITAGRHCLPSQLSAPVIFGPARPLYPAAPPAAPQTKADHLKSLNAPDLYNNLFGPVCIHGGGAVAVPRTSSTQSCQCKIVAQTVRQKPVPPQGQIWFMSFLL